MTATETLSAVDTWLAAWKRVQASHAVIDAQYATRGRCTQAAMREMTRATAACKAWGR
jgi:hypothetical protein